MINIKWAGEKDNPTDDVRLERLLQTFNEMEYDKLEWFGSFIQYNDLFLIGDPACVFKQQVRNAINEEAIYSRKYRISRKSLEEMKRNLKKILEEKFNCVARIYIPLLDSYDPEEWNVARKTGHIRQLLIKAEKLFDNLDVVRVTFGNLL